MNEQVDESPAGSLLEGIIEVIDEFYSANLSQDTMRGMRENAARGYRNGGSAPFGYKHVSAADGAATKSKLVPDEREAPIVAKVFDLAAHGQGAREIVKTLNAEGSRTRTGKHFAVSSINRMLRNEAYVGTIVWNRHGMVAGRRQKKDDSEVIRVPDSHTPIVDKKLFAQVQALVASRRPPVRHPMTVSSQYLLSGLAHCRQCGASAIGTNGKSGKYLYYSCSSRVRMGASVCTARSMNAKKLEEFVLDRVKENILTEMNLRRLVELTNKELRANRRRAARQVEGLDRRSRSVEQKLSYLYSALETGKVDLDDLAPRLRQLRAEQRQLNERRDEALESVSEAGERPLGALVTESYAASLRRLLQGSSFVECKTFLATFIARIEFDRRQVGIEYALPVPAGHGLTGTAEVPNARAFGSSSRTRTCNLVVNSHPLYQLSYRGSPTT